jgi:hypothetical protein
MGDHSQIVVISQIIGYRPQQVECLCHLDRHVAIQGRTSK